MSLASQLYRLCLQCGVLHPATGNTGNSDQTALHVLSHAVWRKQIAFSLHIDQMLLNVMLSTYPSVLFGLFGLQCQLSPGVGQHHNIPKPGKSQINNRFCLSLPGKLPENAVERRKSMLNVWKIELQSWKIRTKL